MADWRNHITEDHEQSVWKVEARSGRKVEAIKAFRTMSGAGLKDAKDIVEEYVDRYARGLTMASDVSTTSVNLPDGAVLSVITNGGYSVIQYTKTEATNLRPRDVHQALVDAALKYA